MIINPSKKQEACKWLLNDYEKINLTDENQKHNITTLLMKEEVDTEY